MGKTKKKVFNYENHFAISTIQPSGNIILNIKPTSGPATNTTRGYANTALIARLEIQVKGRSFEKPTVEIEKNKLNAIVFIGTSLKC